MNKKNNRKGFTTVELVIVIAVIAILATVLIPTFSNLINKANDSNALSEANAAWKNYTIEHATTFGNQTVYIQVTTTDGTVYFEAKNGQLDDEYSKTAPADGSIVIKSSNSNGNIGFECVNDCVDGNDTDTKCDICTKNVTPATP
ncbi:MAG: type II secretion system protein [Ruminococcaceae bacterium]|nr:type II secretion system protein [Oscillospiraceae bacterium]